VDTVEIYSQKVARIIKEQWIDAGHEIAAAAVQAF